MTNHFSFVLQIGFLAFFIGCSDDDAATKAAPSDGDTGIEEDEVEPLDPSEDCARLGLPIRPFDPEDSAYLQRHVPAGDFTVPLLDGTEWTLSEQWSGCDSYIFLPHWLTLDEANTRSWWEEGIDGLLEKSPINLAEIELVLGRLRVDLVLLRSVSSRSNLVEASTCVGSRC